MAVAECFRGDGEILANPIGTIPMIGGRLARATFEPDLCMTDGEAALIANDQAVVAPEDRVVRVLEPLPVDVRLGVVGAAPRDDGRHPGRPLRQPEPGRHRRLRQAQGPAARLPRAPRATRSTTPPATGCPTTGPRCSSRPSTRSSGIGWDRAAALGDGGRFVEIRRVVSNLGVFDFDTADRSMRLRSVHPGVTVDEVVAATGFAARRARRRARVAAADGHRARAHPRGDRPRRHPRARGPRPGLTPTCGSVPTPRRAHSGGN